MNAVTSQNDQSHGEGQGGAGCPIATNQSPNTRWASRGHTQADAMRRSKTIRRSVSDSVRPMEWERRSISENYQTLRRILRGRQPNADGAPETRWLRWKALAMALLLQGYGLRRQLLRAIVFRCCRALPTRLPRFLQSLEPAVFWPLEAHRPTLEAVSEAHPNPRADATTPEQKGKPQ